MASTSLNAPSTILSESVELITFRSSGLLLGIDILQVKEINCHLRHTPVPFFAGDVCGVINLRGEVLTVIDLARLLRLSSVAHQGEPRYVIVASEKERIALLVDAIDDVLTLDRGDFKPVPANFRSVPRAAVSGIYPVAEELLIVLDVDGALNLRDESATT
jgi:purine-binding chemotaxis protein CheW